jgi:hypothetical protein
MATVAAAPQAAAPVTDELRKWVLDQKQLHISNARLDSRTCGTYRKFHAALCVAHDADTAYHAALSVFWVAQAATAQAETELAELSVAAAVVEVADEAACMVEVAKAEKKVVIRRNEQSAASRKEYELLHKSLGATQYAFGLKCFCPQVCRGLG